ATSLTCGNWDLTGQSSTLSGTATDEGWLVAPVLQCVTNSARLLGVSPAITAPIPEPTTATLLLIATAGAATRRKRQHP
ncbi:MAG: PEP-CTERM sorting domain-containing protein, partial [Planctomycetota bacterium]